MTSRVFYFYFFGGYRIGTTSTAPTSRSARSIFHGEGYLVDKDLLTDNSEERTTLTP